MIPILKLVIMSSLHDTKNEKTPMELIDAFKIRYKDIQLKINFDIKFRYWLE